MADGAEYLIAIGAVMTGGDAAIRQLDGLTKGLLKADPAVDTLEKALAQAQTALAQTGAAADAAAAEVALGERAYKRAANEARAMARAMDSAGAGGGPIPATLVARADAAAAAVKAEGAALDATRQKATQAATAHAAMASSAAKLEAGTEAAAEKMPSLGEKIASVARAAIDGAKALYSIGSALYSVGSTIATKFVAPAMRAHDEIKILRARLDALSGGAAAGREVHAMLRDLATEVGSTEEALAPLAMKLLAIGVPVDELRGKVKMLAAQEALGMGGTDAVIQVLTKLGDKLKLTSTDMGWLKEDFTQLAKTSGVTGEAIADELGMSVDQLDEQLKAGTVDAKKISDAITKIATAKGLPVLEAQAQSLDAKLDQLTSAGKDLFADVATGPIIAALDSVKATFDANTASGKAMRASLAGAFAGLGAAITQGLPALISMIQKATAVVSDAVDAYNLLAGNGNVGNTADIAAFDKKLADERAGQNAAAIAKANAAIASVTDILAATTKPAQGAGSNAAAGYTAGVVSGTPAAVAASKSLGEQSVAAMQGAIDAHSPSRKFMALGRFAGEGFAIGLQQTAPIATALDMLPGVPATGGGTTVANNTSKSVSLTGPFYFYGVEDAEDAESRFSALLTRAIEGDVAQLGAGEQVA